MLLECTVFLCGAVCMAVEMVGARLLAPYVGTSSIVWAGVIGIMLAFLACGAWLGGKWADKRLDRRVPALILTAAGLGCALAAAAGGPVADAVTRRVGNLYAAAVICSAAVFAVPALFFGMLTPYIIRLRLADLSRAGATVGRLSALSTAGSILGTFLGGFVLISYFPTRAILWGMAAALLLLSFAHTIRRGLPRAAALIFCLLMAADALPPDAAESDAPPPLTESACNSLRIWHDAYMGRAVRLLATDPGHAQSLMALDDPADLCASYTRYYRLGPLLAPRARNILMLGGGGYSVPKWLLADRSGLPADFRLTVVELDPVITALARRWFALPDDPRLHIVHEDARTFLRRNARSYDLVLVDVFTSQYSVPFHMGTVEAAREMRRAVSDDGALLMNVISAASGPDARLLQGIRGALAEAFEEVQVYCVGYPDRPSLLQNVMLLALPRKRPLPSPDALGDAELADMLRSRCVSCESGDATPPLRDDFAPVERYTLKLARRD